MLKTSGKMRRTLKQIKRIAIAVLGFTIILIGILLIVTPGPAVLVIPAGLGVLGTEFMWAKKLHEKLKSKLFKKAKAAK